MMIIHKLIWTYLESTVVLMELQTRSWNIEFSAKLFSTDTFVSRVLNCGASTAITQWSAEAAMLKGGSTFLLNDWFERVSQNVKVAPSRPDSA